MIRTELVGDSNKLQANIDEWNYMKNRARRRAAKTGGVSTPASQDTSSSPSHKKNKGLNVDLDPISQGSRDSTPVLVMRPKLGRQKLSMSPLMKQPKPKRIPVFEIYGQNLPN